ncbi:MAG: hypothetical protein GXP61_08840 [Epsilonproteobacteria bacterium]|nr:hypothetical protein [Campylobacterota bacterium]
MSLKENIDSIKQEIGAEEQFLESIIKTEIFYKKYKRQVQAGVAILIIAAIGYASYSYIQQRDLRLSNIAYETLLKSPNNTKALNTLKDKNPPLYQVYSFRIAVRKKDATKLAELAKDKKYKFLADLSQYQLAQIKNTKVVNSELLKGFALLEEGYDLLKEGKKTQAELKFAQIDENSPLYKIVKNLEHYQGKSK